MHDMSHDCISVDITVIVEFNFPFTNVPNSKYDTAVPVMFMFNDTASHVSSMPSRDWRFVD